MRSSDLQHPLSKLLPHRPLGPMRSPARVLGWFSIGLGLAELALPSRLAQAAGTPDARSLVRAYGLREIGVGIGLLAARDPQPWLWARVAGDVLDIATVTSKAPTSGAPAWRALATLGLLAGITAIDYQCAKAAAPAAPRRRGTLRDYSQRSGFPKPPAQMRGAATKPLSET